MKQLQNNFTTPEQSKRLLELGVPADSADCYHDLSLNRRGMLAINGVYSLDVPYNHFFSDGKHRFLPCWSVGRLIEILITCGIGVGVPDELFINKYSLTPSLITNLIRRLERAAASGVNNINFSKLEE